MLDILCCVCASALIPKSDLFFFGLIILHFWTQGAIVGGMGIDKGIEGGVRYHCGGWPEEVNTCFLNSYMVYL
jgi:hypothetical protein